MVSRKRSGKTLIGSHVQIGEHGVHAFGECAGLPRGGVAVLRLDMQLPDASGAVEAKELAGQIHDRVAVPHIVMRGSSVTVAMTSASRFSSLA